MIREPNLSETPTRPSNGDSVCIVGFDSAWTNNPAAPGAICSIALRNGAYAEFSQPQPATFSQAARFIQSEYAKHSVCVVAIDQPTRVPNLTGCRPVERVAGSLVSFVGGGVQPANRSKKGIFDDAAPLWRFLKELDATEEPERCRTDVSGLFLIEVFPALALPSFNGDFYGRLKGPKYNPKSSKFRIEHWNAVIETVRCYAVGEELWGIEAWSTELAMIAQPRKLHQDQLDAVLCCLIGYHWRMRSGDKSIMIGDTESGYMISPISLEAGQRLRAAAAKRNVRIS